jgi:HAD superfamily hydrolase (TIGR01509 family)
VAAAGLPRDEAGQGAAVAEWHRRKTAIYIELVKAGRLPARAGIERIVREAHGAGWRLAVCSTSAEASVRAILDNAVGGDMAAEFLVLAGDVVAHKKPAPDIYLLALERLGIDAAEAIVVEDSANGLAAATAAGLTTIVTVNGYTQNEDFSTAALVVSSLGDPGGPGTEVIENRSAASPGDYITLDDLATLVG